jgi:hypothetical protein
VLFKTCWIKYPLIVLPAFSSANKGHLPSSVEQGTVGGQHTPTLLGHTWQRGLGLIVEFDAEVLFEFEFG